MPNYTTTDGTPFSTSWTQDQIVSWLTSRGVTTDVAMQEATTDLLRYGDDLPRVLQSMLPHLLERSNTFLKTGQGTDSSTLNAPPENRVAAPVAVASVVTTMGAAEPAHATPTVGPVGLAYPDDPVNYSTMEVSPSNGYSSGGILPSGIYSPALAPTQEGVPMAVQGAPRSDNTMLYVVLAVVAVGGYLLLAK